MDNHKGIAIYIVIVILLIVVALAAIAVVVMRSQTTLTQHQVTRIQAYYAGLGGLAYAYDSLTRNPVCWPATGDIAFTICREAADANCGGACSAIDPSLPRSILRVQINALDYGSGINIMNSVGGTLPTRQMNIRVFYVEPPT